MRRQQTVSLQKGNAQADSLHQQLQTAKQQHAQELQAINRAHEHQVQQARANLEEVQRLVQASRQADAEAKAKIVAEAKEKASAIAQDLKKDLHNVRRTLHNTEQTLAVVQQTSSAALAAEKALNAAHHKQVHQLQQDLALAQRQLAEEKERRPVQYIDNRYLSHTHSLSAGSHLSLVTQSQGSSINGQFG